MKQLHYLTAALLSLLYLILALLFKVDSGILILLLFLASIWLPIKSGQPTTLTKRTIVTLGVIAYLVLEEVLKWELAYLVLLITAIYFLLSLALSEKH